MMGNTKKFIYIFVIFFTVALILWFGKGVKSVTAACAGSCPPLKTVCSSSSYEGTSSSGGKYVCGDLSEITVDGFSHLVSCTYGDCPKKYNGVFVSYGSNEDLCGNGLSSRGILGRNDHSGTCGKVCNLCVGVCGTADKYQYASSDPFPGTFTLCDSTSNSALYGSSPSSPAPGGTAYWSCIKDNKGASTACSANRSLVPVDGKCGSAAGESFNPSDTASNTGWGTTLTFCSSGNINQTPDFPTVSTSASWSCVGIAGGTTDKCGASMQDSPACGSANGANYVTSPPSDLCSVGTSSGVTVIDYDSSLYPGYSYHWWYWTCGGTQACYAGRIINASCGTANNHSYNSTESFPGSYSYCASGSGCSNSPTDQAYSCNLAPSTGPAVGGSASWRCLGSYGGSDINGCSANRKCVANAGQSCVSASNVCGQTNAGTYDCAGTCSAVTPSLPANYGQACNSADNACGQHNAGTYNCIGCSASTPSDPASYGTTCTSTPNSCGATGSGNIDCNGSCNASIPDVPAGGCGGGSCTLGDNDFSSCADTDIGGGACSNFKQCINIGGLPNWSSCMPTGDCTCPSDQAWDSGTSQCVAPPAIKHWWEIIPKIFQAPDYKFFGSVFMAVPNYLNSVYR